MFAWLANSFLYYNLLFSGIVLTRAQLAPESIPLDNSELSGSPLDQGQWGTCVGYALTRVVADVLQLKYNIAIHEDSFTSVVEQKGGCLAACQPVALIRRLGVMQSVPDMHKKYRYDIHLEAFSLASFDRMYREVMFAPGWHRVIVSIKSDWEGHESHAVAARSFAPAQHKDVILCTNSWGATQPLMDCTRENFKSAVVVDARITNAYQYMKGSKVEAPVPDVSSNYNSQRKIGAEIKVRSEQAEWEVPMMELYNSRKNEVIESPEFGIGGQRLKLLFYPHGKEGAEQGQSSLYLWSREPGIMAWDLSVNSTSKAFLYTFEANTSRGVLNFCGTPTEADVVISLTSRSPFSPSANQSSWSLPVAGFSNFPKGHMIESAAFQIDGHTLKLRFYPHGSKVAEDGQSSLYLWSQESATLVYDLSVHSTTLSSVSTFGPSDVWGWRNFCETPSFDGADNRDIVVSVTLRAPFAPSPRQRSWSLPVFGFSNYPKGKAIESPPFQIDNHTLKLRFYPHGSDRANAGQSSLYLWSKEPGTLACDLSVHSTTLSSVSTFEANDVWGWDDFCETPTADDEDDDDDIVISVLVVALSELAWKTFSQIPTVADFSSA